MMVSGSLDLWRDAEFRKSSFSGGQSGSCVEVARGEALFGIRDSKNVGGPVLMIEEASGRGFLAAIKQLS